MREVKVFYHLKGRAGGFTLAEMLVVIGLICVIALFSGRQYLYKHHETKAMSIINDILTVATAAQADYVDRGMWQDENGLWPCESLFEDLNNVRFANIELNQDADEGEHYDFDCPDVAGHHPMLEITWEMPNASIQEIVHQNLPLSAIKVGEVLLETEVVDANGNRDTVYQVRHYVIAPSANQRSVGIRLGRERIINGVASFDLNGDCGEGLTAEVLSESTSGFCSSQAISGYSLYQENGPSGDRALYVYETNGNGRWVRSSDTCNDSFVDISILYRCLPSN
ncbi:MAG: prepilin-type N-terminal cleavage/methylation domain-containing protein [Pseudomonadales bacterium]|nr:prepilin-type N-terminal cleavage/methylation domain-containing protein [Pseudomonadales bacterium]